MYHPYTLQIFHTLKWNSITWSEKPLYVWDHTEAIWVANVSNVFALKSVLNFLRWSFSAPKGTNSDTSIIFVPRHTQKSRTTNSLSIEAIVTPSYRVHHGI